MVAMKILEDIAKKIEQDMDEKDAVREVALKSSRSVIRLCSSAIKEIHKNGENVDSAINDAAEELNRLVSVTNDFPDLAHSGFVESAMQEFSEVKILHAIKNGTVLPYPEEINVTNEGYLLGTGDAIGELRRLAVDSLRSGQVDLASQYLDRMEDLFDFLMRFHYPSALVDIKRKQDTARGVIEKTRGEIAVAVRTYALEKKIAAHIG